MKKEEILKKYRSEQVDEGKEHLNQVADSKAFVSMCIFAMVIMTYQIARGAARLKNCETDRNGDEPLLQCPLPLLRVKFRAKGSRRHTVNTCEYNRREIRSERRVLPYPRFQLDRGLFGFAVARSLHFSTTWQRHCSPQFYNQPIHAS